MGKKTGAKWEGAWWRICGKAGACSALGSCGLAVLSPPLRRLSVLQPGWAASGDRAPDEEAAGLTTDSERKLRQEKSGERWICPWASILVTACTQTHGKGYDPSPIFPDPFLVS